MTVIETMKARGIIPRAALYARFSSDNQREESIDAQLRAMREYCKRNKVVIANEYCDHARSATTDDRPEFQKMIQESKNCEFDIVIVHKLDRFSRDRYDSAYYKRELKKCGVSLISVLENLDASPESIILESDNEKWNVDSTGARHLVWVWYRTSADSEYRNLNIEILQEGLAIGSNTGQNRYGEIALDALDQAKRAKLKVFSNVKDPDFYYGEAVQVTLAELRTNIANYDGVKVAFEATVARCYNDGVFVESYDDETGTYNGIYIYYGQDLAQLGSKGQRIISTIGNHVKVVGKVSFYETGNSYQITDLKLKLREPENPDNLVLISEGNEIPYTELTADAFTSKVERTAVVDGEEVLREFDYAELLLATSVSMKGLVVESIYTTTNEASSSKGAMTLTCKVGDKTVDVRTEVLKDAEGNVITAEYFEGKTIDVRGVVDRFDGTYQIKVFTMNDITVN